MGKMSANLRAGGDEAHPTFSSPVRVCSKPAVHVSGTENTTLPLTKTLNTRKRYIVLEGVCSDFASRKPPQRTL